MIKDKEGNEVKQLTLRMPFDIYKMIKQDARENFVTVTAYIVKSLKESLVKSGHDLKRKGKK